MYLVYNKKTYECYGVSALSKEDIILQEDEAVFDVEVQSAVSDDIRAYNSDGSIKTIREQVDLGVIELKENEIIREDENGQWIDTLNKNMIKDRIELIERGVEKLEPTEKIVDEYGKKTIKRKTEKELYEDNLITAEEYNEHIRNNRRIEYMKADSGVDKVRWALINDFLKSNYENMSKEQQEMWNYIVSRRQEIKEANSKVNVVETMNPEINRKK